MEINGETKDLEPLQKISVSISVFQGYFKDLIVDGEQGILRAESLQKQVKAIKSLAKSSTEIEWKTKKTAYEESRDETEKKKKEYYDIRDKRNALMNACTDIFNGIKTKIGDFRAECVRKAEEARRAKEKEEEANRKRIAAESKAREDEALRIEAEKKKAEVDALAEEQRKIDEEERFQAELVAKRKEEQQEEKVFCEFHQINNPAKMNGCPECKTSTPGARLGETEENKNIIDVHPENKPDSEPVEATSKTTDSDATSLPQKSEEGQKEPIPGEIEITITDFSKFIRACVMGVDGASLKLLKPDIEAIIELARKKGCNKGDVVVPGCEVKEVK